MKLLVLQIGSTTQAAWKWGARNVRLTTRSLAPDELAFDIPAASVHEAPAIVVWDAVKLWVYESDDGETPKGTGRREFEGEVWSANARDDGGSVSFAYVCRNAWAKLEVTSYYQDWQSLNPGGTPYGSTLAVLFMNTSTVLGPETPPEYPGGYPHYPGTVLITGGQQIYDTVSWLQGLGVKLRPGQARDAVEPVGLFQPIQEKFDLKAWEVVRVSLEKAPDVVSYVDYWSDPSLDPAVWFKRRSQLDAVTLTLGGAAEWGQGQDGVASLEPRGRNDLMVPAVHVHYMQTDTVDGQRRIASRHDYWPLDQWDAAKQRLKDSALITGGQSQTVFLEGSQTTTTVQTFAGTLVAPMNIAWWRTKFPELDSALNAVQATDPNQLLDTSQSLPAYSSLATPGQTGWDVVDLATGASMRDALLAGTWYEITGGGSVPNSEIAKGKVVKQVRFAMKPYVVKPTGDLDGTPRYFETAITDATPGVYRSVNSWSEREPCPLDATNAALGQTYAFARMVYESAGQLYYEGGVTLREQFPSFKVRVGNVVNVLGKDGETTYGSMRALVQQVSYHFDSGTTQIAFGYPRWLGVAELLDFYRISRVRYRWQRPEVMGDGTAFGGGGDVEFPKWAPNQWAAKQEALQFAQTFYHPGDKTTYTEIMGGQKQGTDPPGVLVSFQNQTVAYLRAGSSKGVLFIKCMTNGAQAVADVSGLPNGLSVGFFRMGVCVDDGAGNWSTHFAWVWGAIEA